MKQIKELDCDKIRELRREGKRHEATVMLNLWKDYLKDKRKEDKKRIRMELYNQKKKFNINEK